MTTPRVDFYVLSGEGTPERFACVMAGKAWQRGNITCLHTDSRENAMTLDDMLWTFRDISFVPHALQDDPDGAPVMIGWEACYPDNVEVLINLTNVVPDCAEHFSRIVEIVAGDETRKRQARERYKAYRDRGYELHNHVMDNDHVPAG